MPQLADRVAGEVSVVVVEDAWDHAIATSGGCEWSIPVRTR